MKVRETTAARTESSADPEVVRAAAMKKMAASNVLIIGVRGLGVEIGALL